MDLEEARKALCDSLGAKVQPTFMTAKDGPEAERRTQNQKFDVIIIDPQVPRINEGLFLKTLKTDRNTKNANIVLMLPDENWNIPAMLTVADQKLVAPCALDLLVRALAKCLATPDAKADVSAGGSFAVDARVLNAIVKASCFVCQQFGIEATKFQKPQVQKKDGSWSGDIAATIDIKSQKFQGRLVLSFDQSVYLKLLENMLGEVQTAINAENADAIGELTNMILGNAKADFTEYNIAMSIPKILQKGTIPDAVTGCASILLAGDTPHGLFYIEVVAYPKQATAAA